MAPLVSVVIPSYNHSKYVGQAIESVLSQSYPNVELVVVDDGSTDNSRDVICEVLSNKPSRNTKLIEQDNAGAHAAIMRGISESKGQLIAILNSDDFYYPNRFEVMVEQIADDRLAFAVSKLDLVGDDGNTLPDTSAWPKWYRKALSAIESNPTIGFALLDQNFAVTSGNFLFTRELYEKLCGFSSHKFLHDWDFLIRAIYYCEPIYVNRSLMTYRIHEKNTTQSVRDRLPTEEREALERYLELFENEKSPNPFAPHSTNWPNFFESFAVRADTPFARRTGMNRSTRISGPIRATCSTRACHSARPRPSLCKSSKLKV